MWGQELIISFFGITVLGSVIVAAVVEKLKTWFKTTGWVNTALALAVGTALGAVVHLIALVMVEVGMAQEAIPLMAALIQGFFSGGVAAGLWKSARTLSRNR